MAKAGSRRRKTWTPDKEGRYSRQLGWKFGLVQPRVTGANA